MYVSVCAHVCNVSIKATHLRFTEYLDLRPIAMFTGDFADYHVIHSERIYANGQKVRSI